MQTSKTKSKRTKQILDPMERICGILNDGSLITVLTPSEARRAKKAGRTILQVIVLSSPKETTLAMQSILSACDDIRSSVDLDLTRGKGDEG